MVQNLEKKTFIQDYLRETPANFQTVNQECVFFMQITFHKHRNILSGMKNQLGFFVPRNPIKIDNLSA